MELGRLGLGGAALGVSSFVASSHPAESCGLNGLPLTPPSISIQGAGQLLLTANHPNLARYLHIQRGKHQRIILVVEKWERSLKTLRSSETAEPDLLDISKQILLASAYLNQMNIVNLNLGLDTVMLTDSGQVKLAGYGLGRLTNYGAWVAFPLGDPRLTAPEVFRQPRLCRQAPEPDGEPGGWPPPFSPRCDTWSLGLLLAMLCLDIPELWPGARVGQVVRKVASLADCEGGPAVVERVAREHGCLGRVATIPQPLLDLIHLCLQPGPARPSPAQLLQSDIFPGLEAATYMYTPPVFPSQRLRCAELPSQPQVPQAGLRGGCDLLTGQEVCHLWQLAGGDPQAELRRQGRLVSTPPVLALPRLATAEGQTVGQPRQRGALFDPVVSSLSRGQLESCLAGSEPPCLLPLLEPPQPGPAPQPHPAQLPLVIRERDVRYQSARVALYRRLLQSFPHRAQRIWQESLTDVVPIYRAQVWAALLGVPTTSTRLYSAIDKESPSPVDRQIEVDIPRCHQYNELLASPEGHRKLKRVLKAWVVDNPGLVYWQGLDSLAAPFLFLNFNDEALAWSCLSAFIPKYLHNMFLKENAAVIQEYLAKFSHLQAFHDPELFNHLDDIGFIPDLYAIPWVLTMFSHVFPLHKIFHLWDRLLLGNSSFPLCIGLGVLTQLRAQLLEAQFNECILLFSDMPAVEIEGVVNRSMEVFTSTPASLTWRQHERPRTGQPGPLDMTPLSVQELKSEKVGRISGAELVSLAGAAVSKVTIIDIRSAEEFRLGTVPGAASLPAEQLMAGSGTGQDWAGEREVLDTARRRGKVICVLGSGRDRAAATVAEWLLNLGFPRLCTLHGGVEVFRNSGVLVAPHA